MKYNGKYSLSRRLLEGQDPEKLATLARALAATGTGDKSRIGDIGEEIADLFMQGINLNDVKDNTQFPFADVASGPITRLKDVALYSVKASGEIIEPKKEGGKYSGRDVFNNSSPHGGSINSLVNKRGNNGLRDEIDAQFGADAKKITLKLGVIGIDVRPNRDTGEPEGLMVRKYGPASMTFEKNEETGDFEHPAMGVESWRSRGAIENTFGTVKVLSDPSGGGFEGRDEMIGADGGVGSTYRQGSIAINPEGLEDRMEKEAAVRDSLARMTDAQVDQMIDALNNLV